MSLPRPARIQRSTALSVMFSAPAGKPLGPVRCVELVGHTGRFTLPLELEPVCDAAPEPPGVLVRRRTQLVDIRASDVLGECQDPTAIDFELTRLPHQIINVRQGDSGHNISSVYELSHMGDLLGKTLGVATVIRRYVKKRTSPPWSAKSAIRRGFSDGRG